MSVPYDKIPFTCKSNSKTVRGFILKPELDGKLPAVIVSHGMSGCAVGVERHALPFAGKGYVTVYFAFCGGGPKSESDGAMMDMTLDTLCADLTAVFNYTRTLDYVDSARISLQGGSQGGLVSVLFAAKHTDEIQSLILFAPGLPIPEMVREGAFPGSRFDPAHPPELIDVNGMKISRRYIQTAQKVDAYGQLEQCKCPVLICHGTADETFRVSQIEKVNELKRDDLTLKIIQGGDHAFAEQKRDEAFQEVFKFLDSLQ